MSFAFHDDDAIKIIKKGNMHTMPVLYYKEMKKKYGKFQAIQLPSSEFHQLCTRLVESLKESQRFNEAAVILEWYMSDSEEAIATLIEGRNWAEASRLISSYQRPDLRGKKKSFYMLSSEFRRPFLFLFFQKPISCQS